MVESTIFADTVTPSSFCPDAVVIVPLRSWSAACAAGASATAAAEARKMLASLVNVLPRESVMEGSPLRSTRACGAKVAVLIQYPLRNVRESPRDRANDPAAGHAWNLRQGCNERKAFTAESGPNGPVRQRVLQRSALQAIIFSGQSQLDFAGDQSHVPVKLFTL